MRSKERVEAVFEELESLLTSVSSRFDLIIVFGSYARGYPREDSDLDLYFVTDDLPERRIQTECPSDLDIPWSDALPDADITALTPEEFVYRYHKEEDFVHTVLDEGAYVEGYPRDVRNQLDFDPIADDLESLRE